MEEINPLLTALASLAARMQDLRGYL